MEEESSKKKAEPTKASMPRKVFLPQSPMLAPKGAIPPLKSPPWGSAPVYNIHPTSFLAAASPDMDCSHASTKDTSPFGKFLPSKSPAEKERIQLPGRWASSPNKNFSSVCFQDIQQQEQELKAKAKTSTMGGNSKWYIDKRERTGSFREIEEEETKKREFEMLVEEQREIERQIQEDLKRNQTKNEKKQAMHTQNRRRNKNRKEEAT